MTRFSASAIDPSRADKSLLWPIRSFETYRAERLVDLKARLTIAGIPFDVEGLETDPGVYLQETGAYRELIIRSAIDDAQQKELLAFSWGPYLDELGRMWGTARMVNADGTPESDNRYRTRIQLAPEAFPATGTAGGYIYHAMSVDASTRDAACAVLGRGTPDCMVEMTILSSLGTGIPSDAVMDAIRTQLYGRNIKLLTDVVVARPVQILEYDLEAVQYARSGPDPATIRSASTAAALAMGDSFKRIGSRVPANVFDASLYASGVDRVVISKPSADIVPKRYQAGSLRNVSLKTVITDD